MFIDDGRDDSEQLEKAYIRIEELESKLALAVEALEKVGALMLCGKKDHLPIRCDKANKVIITTLTKLKEKV